MDNISSNEYIEKLLDNKIEIIGECLKSDVITIISGMMSPIDNVIRESIEGIKDKNKKLLVVMETNGGQVEIVERIASIFRNHYPENISFLIPDHAMSAGTILCMSGDDIYMDYYSVLGPIDPQVPTSDQRRYVPALGYLEKYNDFVKKSREGSLTNAEMALFIQKFDMAELHQFEKARDLSIELLETWLAEHKFKNWAQTAGRHLPVSETMKKERAKEIASALNDTSRWKTHSRGISKDVLSLELGLLIEDFADEGKFPGLSKAVHSYYRLLQDHMVRMRHFTVVHRNGCYIGF